MYDDERGYGPYYRQDDGEAAWFQPPGPRRKVPRWLFIGALALAFALTLGVGEVLGSSILQSAQASGFTPAGVNLSQTLASGPATGRQAGAPGQQGQCGVLTVSSVSGQTIVAKAADGSTVTIHTTSSTQYTSAGKSASASAVQAGVQIHVAGTHNSDGSITATHIDIG